MTGTCYLQEENDFKKLCEQAEYIAEEEKYFKLMGHKREDKLEQKDENGKQD